MALVCRRGVALALEDVTEVATAVGTDNLGAGHAKGFILVADNSARNAIEIGWPTTPRAELVSGLVQRRLAAGAGVDAGLRGVLVIFPGTRGFGTLLSQDAELLLV